MKTSEELGPEVLKLFGLPEDNCIWANIHFEVKKLVTIRCKYFLDDLNENKDAFETIVKKYELREIE